MPRGLGGKHLPLEPPEGAALWTPWIWHVGALRTWPPGVAKGHVSEFFGLSPGSEALAGWKGTSSSGPNRPLVLVVALRCWGGWGRPVPPASVLPDALQQPGKEVLKVL